MIQKNSVAPNGLWYTEQDFSNAFPSDFVDLGGAPKKYRSICHVQNGDGVGSDPTTWKGSESIVHFDPGFTYSVHATGRDNRLTEWGNIAYGVDGEPVGYDGLLVYFGAATTIAGNMKLGGCELRNLNAAAAGSIFLFPTSQGLVGEVIDTDVYTGGTQGYGNLNGALSRVRRLTAAGFGAGNNGRVVQFNCLDADTPTFYFPNGNQKLSTSGFVIIRNPRFIGPSASADIALSGGGFIEGATWSRACVIMVTQTKVETFQPVFGVVRAAGVRVANALVRIYDKNNRLVVDVRTDSLGQLPQFPMPTSLANPTQGTPFSNVLCVMAFESPTRVYQGPWRVEVNSDGAIAGYPKAVQMIEAPYAQFLTTEREFYPIGFNVDLAGPNATTDIPFFEQGSLYQMLLNAGGQTVSCGGIDTIGIVEHRNREINGALVGEEIVVTVEVNTLPALGVGVDFGAEGVTRRVRDIREVDDGALVEVYLAVD